MSVQQQVESILNPRSVAVIGASNAPVKWGGSVLALLGIQDARGVQRAFEQLRQAAARVPGASFEVGMVNRVAEKGAHQEAAFEYAEQLAKLLPAMLRTIKLAVKGWPRSKKSANPGSRTPELHFSGQGNG